MRPKQKAKTEWEKLEHLAVGRLTILKKQDPEVLKNIRSDTGEGVLHIACRSTFFENVAYLVREVGCDVNLKDASGVTPLECALRCGYSKETDMIVKLLLKKVDLLAYTQRIFEDPYLTRNLRCALMQFKGGAEKVASHLRRKGWTLDQVARIQDDQITSHFLSKLPEYQHYKDLVKLAYSSDALAFKRSLQHVAHSKRITSWALLNASTKNQPIIVKLLLDSGAPVEGFPGDQGTPLNNALARCNASNCELLFERGARCVDKSVLRYLREKMRRGHDANAEKCLRLVFEYRGLWCASEGRNFEDIQWLIGLFNVDLPILKLVLEYLSRERQPDGPEDKFLPPNYYLKCFEYYSICSKVVTDMKARKLGGVPVSLYDLLVKNTDELVVFTRNENLMKQIRALEIESEFPVHGTTLRSKLDKARKKRLLIDQSVKILRTCLPSTGSDGLVLKKIVGYLGVPNLLCYDENKTQ